jgi:hypothetical protein
MRVVWQLGQRIWPPSRALHQSPPGDQGISRQGAAHDPPDVYTGGDSGNPQARKDTGKQSDREALRASLLYMQETINATAAEESAVWAFPTFVNAPIPSTEEVDCAMQAKAQHDLAASQDSLALNEDAFLDSMQLRNR